MNDEILSIKTVLETAAQRELMSIRLYDHAISVAESDEVKAMLQRLRDDEDEHYRLLMKAIETGRPEVLGKRPVPVASRLQPKKAPKAPANIETVKSAKELIEYAIGHEEMAIDYFSRYVDAFRGTGLGELFERLRKEEELHRSKLEAEMTKGK